MFVRKDKDGNLIAVGSVNHARLTQLQAASKRPKKAAAPKGEPPADPPAKVPAAEPDAPPVQAGAGKFKSALDKG